MRLENKYLVANWPHGAFTDPDDPYDLLFQYALGKYKIRSDYLRVKILLNEGLVTSILHIYRSKATEVRRGIPEMLSCHHY